MIRPMKFIAILLCVVAIMPAGRADALSLIRDAEIERTLKAMSAPILRAAGLAPDTVNIYMVRDRSLNAFVAGGRNIFLHTGLMMDLETPEELLGVIAHEAGHIAGGHIARRAINIRNARGPALLGALLGIAAGVAGGGEAGAAIAAGTQGAVQRSLLSNSRAEEASADQAAVSYLVRSGIDPAGLMMVVERFRGQEVLSIGSVDPYILTHPLGTQRMALLQRRVEEVSGRSFSISDENKYWHARMRAKLIGFLRNPSRVLDDVEGEPETELTLYKKAVALHRVPDPSAAIAAADRLIALRPNDPFYIELKGQILLESRRVAEAIAPYRQAVKLAPNEPLLLSGLGRALVHSERPELNGEALKVLKRARAKDLADVTALRDLALAYDRAGDRAMATLATAERYALIGNTKNAVGLAKRAAKLLSEGTPGWLRAQDILKLEKKDD
ncbi:MAG: M48 family metalloprotease [Pseudomonadota bacterium]